VSYEHLALRTVSPGFHPNELQTSELFYRIHQVVEACQALDKVKKTLFYGKPYEQPTPIPDTHLDIGSLSQAEIDILHGAIGLATEAGEMMEIAAQMLFSWDDIDLIHLQEEMGDVFWYLALLACRCGRNFTEIQEQNLAKLQARYPEKFTEAAALTRDLDAERKVLTAA
jgi:NTP pyrophosphatase (non-canonical NTP hydrolase)